MNEELVEEMINAVKKSDQCSIIEFLQTFKDQNHFWLAANASFPVALTSHLAYNLLMNFPTDTSGNYLYEGSEYPVWIVSEFLHSPIVKVIGHDIYEIVPSVKSAFLKFLNKDLQGIERLRQLALFMKNYVNFCRGEIPTDGLLEAQILNYEVYLLSCDELSNKISSLVSETKSRDESSRLIAKSKVEYLLNYDFLNLGVSSNTTTAEAILNAVKSEANLKKNPDDEEALDKLREAFKHLSQEGSDGFKIKIPPSVQAALINEGLIKSKDQWAFKNIWILVAGTGAYELPKSQILVAEAIGRMLAKEGYGLVSGGWPGVDHIVARSYYETLQSLQLYSESYLVQMVVKKSDYPEGEIVLVSGDREWYKRVLDKASAVIMIGGEGGTMRLFETALSRNIPSIPLPGTRGDADNAYFKLEKLKFPHLPAKLMKSLKEGSEEEHLAKHLSNKVKEILERLFIVKGDRKFELAKFEAEVNKIYKSTEIIEIDDLQKSRWGGKNNVNEKILSATVYESSKGIFKVTLRITKEDRFSNELVAFFIHDSFPNEILYSEFKNGKVEVDVVAYESFTVGAMTEDGTLLELDLNEVTGFPEKFYYEQKSKITKFKAEVNKIYKSREILEIDDLQKSRWGGKSNVNGKILSATVHESSKGIFKVTLNITKKDHFSNELVAFFIHDSFPNEILYSEIKNGMVEVDVVAYESFTVGVMTEDGTLLELDLNEVKGYPENFYYLSSEDYFHQFQVKVKRLYSNTKKTNRHDIQKGKWGGLSFNNDKELSAAVEYNPTNNHFDIRVEIVPISKEPLIQYAAIFLNDSFPEKIRFLKAVDAFFETTVSTTEAFTIGAYLDDGTRLELDLNEVQGYPSEFYSQKSGIVRVTSRILYIKRRPSLNSEDLEKFKQGTLLKFNGVIKKELIRSLEDIVSPPITWYPYLEGGYFNSRDVEVLIENISGFIDKRILWVDDYPINNRSIEDLLKTAEVSITNVLSTEEALKALRDAHFDLIISDMSRGANSQAGLQLLDWLKKIKTPIPVIIFSSSYSVKNHKDDAFTLGAKAVTFDEKELLAEIQGLFNMNQNYFPE